MQHHRFREQLGFAPHSSVATSTHAATAFVACPMVLCQGCMGQAFSLLTVYQRAYECAQAEVRSPFLERFHTISVN